MIDPRAQELLDSIRQGHDRADCPSVWAELAEHFPIQFADEVTQSMAKVDALSMLADVAGADAVNPAATYWRESVAVYAARCAQALADELGRKCGDCNDTGYDRERGADCHCQRQHNVDAALDNAQRARDANQ